MITQSLVETWRGGKPVNVNTLAFQLIRNAICGINMGGDFTWYVYVWETVQHDRILSCLHVYLLAVGLTGSP